MRRVRDVRLGALLGRVGDWALAAVVAAVGMFEVFVAPITAPGYRGPAGIAAVGVLAVAGAVLQRRRFTLAALATIVVVLSVQWAYARGVAQLPNASFFAILVAGYAVGAHVRRAPGLLAMGLAASVFLIQDGLDLEAGYPSVRTDVGFYALLGLAWAAGAGVRALRRRAELLEQLTQELAAEREERARLAAVEERARLARELHDVVAHTVAVMTVHAGAARQLVDADPAEAKATLRSTEQQGRQAMAELRRLLGVLRDSGDSSDREPPSGLRDLRQLAEQVRRGGIVVEVEVHGDPRELPPGLELSAYRVVQEALTNTLKHAAATFAKVHVRYRAGGIELEILDDGRGSADQGNGAGHGLDGLRERVALYGGTLEAGPQPGGGFRVAAVLPLDTAGA